MMGLGLEETLWGWRVYSKELTENQIKSLSRKLINLIGMHEDGPPDCTNYPNSSGKGGYGIQLYQRLVESSLVISTWPKHGFIRIILASCIPYDPQDVTEFLEKNIGKIGASGGCCL